MNAAARRLAALAALFGLTAVILGAFGAHALKDILDAVQRPIYEKAVSYQMYHALAILLVALWLDRTPSKLLMVSGRFFSAGIILFSGSLYLLSTVGWPWLGPVTPLGGLCFITGWLCLAVSFFRARP